MCVYYACVCVCVWVCVCVCVCVCVYVCVYDIHAHLHISCMLTWNTHPYVTVGDQTLQHMTQRCQKCEQGLYDDRRISEK